MTEDMLHRPGKWLLLIVGWALFAAGCHRGAPSAGPTSSGASGDDRAQDPDDVPVSEADVDLPKSYGIAVERIKSYRDTIRSAIENGTPSKAHRPLDELDIVLDKLASIARDSGVPKERWEDVNVSAKELRGLFNQLHAAIDEKRKPDYAAVADPIDEIVGRLEEIASSVETPSGDQAPDSDLGKD